MNRREVLQRAALLMGGAISAPAILGVLKGYAKEPGPDWKPSVLDEDELAIVTRITDIMLPRTDTPGAVDADVPAFIDTLLKEVYSQDARDRYLNGLHEFDAAARKTYRKPFVQLDAPRQETLIRQFQDVAIAQERAASAHEQKELVAEVRNATALPQRTEPAASTKERSFILTTKELALLGYFTSRPGATQVLQYVAIPGAYHGCLPVNQAGNGKRWAT
jgi:gluconate 2-dehydrogenase gamma chain